MYAQCSGTRNTPSQLNLIWSIKQMHPPPSVLFTFSNNIDNLINIISFEVKAVIGLVFHSRYAKIKKIKTNLYHTLFIFPWCLSSAVIKLFICFRRCAVEPLFYWHVLRYILFSSSVHYHCMFGGARSVQRPPTYHEVVIGSQLSSSLHPRIQNMQPCDNLINRWGF